LICIGLRKIRGRVGAAKKPTKKLFYVAPPPARVPIILYQQVPKIFSRRQKKNWGDGGRNEGEQGKKNTI